MKISAIVLFILILFAGCRKEDTVEVIPDYDKIYPLISDQTQVALVKGNEKETKEKINQLAEKAGINKIFSLACIFYINESGKIDKIKAIEYPDSSFTGLLASEIKSWEYKLIKKSRGQSRFSLYWHYSPLFLNGKYYEIKKEEYPVAAEEMPAPLGGIAAIAENILYPEAAKAAGLSGKVYILAFINENGDVVNAEVIKSTENIFNKAALDAVKKTKFTPARNGNKPVKIQVTIPIVFKLG